MPSTESAVQSSMLQASEDLDIDFCLNQADQAVRDRHWTVASELLSLVLRRQPDHLHAALQLETCLDEMNLPDAGVGLLQDLLRGVDGNALALRNVLAFRLNDARRFVETALMENSVSLTFGGRTAFSYALIGLGLFEAAEQALRTIEEHPDVLAEYRAEVARQRGTIAVMNNRYSEAVVHYRQAQSLGCDDRHLHFSLGFALLAAGQWAEGWKHLAWRWRPLRPDLPVWSGEDIRGRVVRVNSEQGAGDVIFALRWLPRLQEAGASVVFQTFPEILAMLESVDDAVELDASPVSEPQPDLQIEILDLPRALGEDAPVEEGAYLHPREELVDAWRQRLEQQAPGLRIGVVWAGNPRQQNDVNRSMALRDFAPLAVLPGISWISLQKGEPEIELLESQPGIRWLALGGELNNFADTAAVIHNLDLLITVCTSTAHVAGAVGAPFWLLATSRHVDFRWLEQGEHTSWYPTARIFRQPRPGAWNGLVKDQLLPGLLQWLDEPGHRARLSELDQCWLQRLRGQADDQRLLTLLEGQGDPIWLSRIALLALEEDDSSLLEQATAVLGSSAPDVAVCAWAEWHRAHQEYDDALELLRALRQNSGGLPADGYRILADVLSALKRPQEARDVLSEGIAAWPGEADLLSRLGSVSWGLGEQEASLAAFVEAARKRSRHPSAFIGAGFVHRQLGDRGAAAHYLQRAALLQPEAPLAWHNLAYLALEAGALRFALSCFERLGQLQPSLDTWQQIGTIHTRLWAQGDPRSALAAVQAFGEARTLDPANAQAAFNLGQALKNCGRWPEAIDSLKQAVQLAPDNTTYQMALGWSLLATGDCTHGWEAYFRGMRTRETRMQEWDGSPLDGRSLLVYQDQGYGDLYQFLDLVNRIPGNVTLAVNHGALTLVQEQGFPFAVRLIDEIDWNAPMYDLQIAQMRLPHLLGADLLRPPLRWPWLKACEERRTRFRQRFAADKALRVGIVWSGSSRFSGNATRSTHFAHWQGLSELQGVSFYSLQKDVYSNQALDFPDFPLVNLAVDLQDFADTAAAICELDLVISTCTAVAHLAGALGKPVWVLLPSVDTDFRWLRDRSDSPWYPSARLFRKRDGQPWEAVLALVGEALEAEVRQRERRIE